MEERQNRYLQGKYQEYNYLMLQRINHDILQTYYQFTMMRKLEKSDRFFIEKMRALIREESELSVNHLEGESTFDQSLYDGFHNELLKNTKIRSIRICGCTMIPKHDQDKQHILYELEVMTDELNYKINRRFRQFYALYKKIKKHLPKECVFPKKNYNPFISSVSQAIIEERKIKLNLFIQDVLQYIITTKDPIVTLKLFNFIQLRENYEDQYMVPSVDHKSSSAKTELNREYTLKGHKSEKQLNNYSENSLEMLISLINEPHNPSRHIKKLQEVIRGKKFKATNEEIKMIFVGFEEYQGVLKFGLSNTLEANRLAALQILIDLLLPERNIAFQKYERVLQKLPIQHWLIEDISYLDSPVFKVHYFRLLKIYLDKVQKNNKGQLHLLKSLFLFHQNLINDYFQWKKITVQDHKLQEQFEKILPISLSIDFSSKIEVSSFVDSFQKIEVSVGKIGVYYYEHKNLVVLAFTTPKTIEQVKEKCLKWNSFTERYEVQEYTGLYRYTMKNQQKKWNIRVKVEEKQLVSNERQNMSSLLPEEFQQSVIEVINKSQYMMSKQQSPFQFYAEYEEEIWVNREQQQSNVVIIVKATRDVQLFEGSLRPWASLMASDALRSFD